MEILEEKVEEFVKNNISEYGDGFRYGSGYGAGAGAGDGFGYADGDGAGAGAGYGYADGSGYGAGDGYGYRYADGDGSGSGSGYGSGDGYGSGSGSGDGIKSINDQNIYHIDDVPTIITNVHNNIAKGKILNDDFSYEDCYVAKGQGYFAHGETIKEAVNSLQEKIFDDLDPEEKIAEFRKLFKNNEKYKGEEFYKWHHILTGSCKMGRDNFIQNHNINLDDEFTVKQFIEITENSYQGQIIKELKEFYK